MNIRRKFSRYAPSVTKKSVQSLSSSKNLDKHLDTIERHLDTVEREINQIKRVCESAMRQEQRE